MKPRYWKHILRLLPRLPKLYIDSKRVRRMVPKLPNAVGPHGISGKDSNIQTRILILGESTMSGLGVEFHREGFAGAVGNYLSELTSSQVVWSVFAESGFTTLEVRKKILPRISIQSSWDVVIIGLGGNDAFSLTSFSKWKKDVLDLINAIRDQFGALSIVFCQMPPVREFPAFTSTLQKCLGGHVELLGEMLAETVRDIDDVYYINEVIRMSSWNKKYNLQGQPEEYFSDGVHPSQLTYQLWGQDVATFIIENEILATSKEVSK